MPKTSDGERLQSRAEALPAGQSSPYLLPPKGSIDPREVVHDEGAAVSQETKEWQAIMDYLRGMTTKNEHGVTVLRMNEQAAEDRSVRLTT